MKNPLIAVISLVILSIAGCDFKRTSEFEFCFATIVNGTVFLEAKVGDAHLMPGILTSFGGPLSNDEYDFSRFDTMDLCGKMFSGYSMTHPDSAFLSWGSSVDKKTTYEKRIKLPPYPKKKRSAKYRVSFAIAYQDCVYCKIDTKEYK